MRGAMGSSTATSPHAREVAGLNSPEDPGSSSPSRKNPKKAVAAIAHTTTLSGLADTTRASCSLAITWAVIGSLMRGGVPLSILMRLMPACTLFSAGREDCSRGSGKPSEICIFRTAER